MDYRITVVDHEFLSGMNYDSKLCFNEFQDNEIEQMNIEDYFENNITYQDGDLILTVPDDKNLEDILNDRASLKKSIENIIKNNKHLSDEEKQKLKVVDVSNYFYMTDYITFDDEVDILKYVYNNPIVIEKTLILPGTYGFGDNAYIKSCDELYIEASKYEDIIDSIYVILAGNNKYVNIMDAIKTTKKIKEMAENIKKLNLSPMENVMYAYDLTKTKIYKREDEEEGHLASRDLTDVLTGDKIVCLGYSHIFQALLSYLGVKCFINYLDATDDKHGHARNIAYIKDDKYDIDGVYYFDSTWDSKKNENDKIYSYNYKYFAKTKEEMDKINLECKFIDTNIKHSIDDIYEDIKAHILDDDFEYLNIHKSETLNLLFKYVDRFDDATNILIHRNAIDKKELLKQIEEVYLKYKNKLNRHTMFELAVNVRKIEEKNLKDYKFSREDIANVFKYSNLLSKSEGEIAILQKLFDDSYYDESMLEEDLEDEFNEKVLKNTRK